MSISKDAVAIIASNLTAAHCASSGIYRPEGRQPTDSEIHDLVVGIYNHYLKAVKSGQPSHLVTPRPQG